MPIYEFENKIPNISQAAFVHPEAVLIGDIVIEKGCFIGPGVVIRADGGPVIIREGTSVQDNVVIHVSPGSEVVVDKGVVVGHSVILHDVHIGPGCVIGMGAILMNEVVCEDGAFVGAGALVSSRMHIPSGKLAVGNPAKIIRGVNRDEASYAGLGAEFYTELADRYNHAMRRI
ncbi:MAG: gamma carbonic anhydrase family protein [Syntrophales bacterium]|jgi:phenylacetic acid degradation protein|nr:gamma carbonic anhydrase family protein [Syntrophales bacterium]